MVGNRGDFEAKKMEYLQCLVQRSWTTRCGLAEWPPTLWRHSEVFGGRCHVTQAGREGGKGVFKHPGGTQLAGYEGIKRVKEKKKCEKKERKT